MTTLADKSLLSGGDNKPPMLEKHLYDSWKSRMELYMMNRPHGRMILASVEKGPLVWPSITVDGVTRLKEYTELTPAEAIQADCDIKAINIILQGLPTEIYALVSQHRVAKDLWEKIKLLMQGTSLTKQERECKLYDEFDKFTYKNGESLHEYSLEGRQTTYATGTTRKYTPGASGSNTGKQRTKQSKTEITSDSNIIPYSQYLSETQQETVQNSNSSTQQDVLILSMFEQLNTQVMNCTNVNLEYKSANKALTTELDRYKEEVKDLKERQNVENSFSGSNEQYAEIERLKQTLSEQVQENDSLMKTVSDLKNDLKMEENRNIDREIALEKKIKQLDNIIFKRGQSAQTVHMMTKSKICYDHSTKQAIGFEKPFYLKKVQESKPKLYDGNVILKMDAIVIPDTDETLMLYEESRSKMLLKEQDPMVVKHRVNTKPINYAILNNDYNKQFFCQSDLYSEHAYWKATSVPALDPYPSSTTNKVEVPKELPKVTQSQQKDTVIVKLKEKIKSLRGNVDDRVRLSTSASGSQPSGNTRNDKILQTPSSNSKNKVEAHSRNVKSSLNKRNGTVKVNGSASVQNSKKHDNSDYVCINGDDCMSSDNLCVSNSMNDVKFRAKSKKRKSKKEIWKPTGKVFTKIGYIWRPTGRTFTIVGNACPLTRITTTKQRMPSRKPIVLESESPKPVVNLVYSRKPRKNKNTESVSKTKVVKSVLLVFWTPVARITLTGDRSRNEQIQKMIKLPR
ncbi:hypothetical protein Tco_1401467 [Tanacetum coccineum]